MPKPSTKSERSTPDVTRPGNKALLTRDECEATAMLLDMWYDPHDHTFNPKSVPASPGKLHMLNPETLEPFADKEGKWDARAYSEHCTKFKYTGE